MSNSKLKKGDFIITQKDLEDFNKGEVYEILDYLPLNPYVEHSWSVNSKRHFTIHYISEPDQTITPIYNEEYLLENFECVKIQRKLKLEKLVPSFPENRGSRAYRRSHRQSKIIENNFLSHRRLYVSKI